MAKYEQPEFHKKAFTCPHCDVYANFSWAQAKELVLIPGAGRQGYRDNDLHVATCTYCEGRVVWFVDDQHTYMLWPFGIENAPLPHDEMPDDVKADYIEARSICALSPRGASALLRLGIQKLCKHLGEKGKNVNDDIGELVKKGLPIQIQQALDVVRVTGNNAVHPGELRLEDKPETASALFGLINLIVENRIAEPRRVAALYESLPQAAREGVEKRDG